MRISDRDGKFTGRQQISDQNVAVAESRLIQIQLAHEIIRLLTSPRGHHAKKPIVGARLQSDLTIAPLRIEQILPASRNFSGLQATRVVSNGVIVVVDIHPTVLLVLELVRIKRQLVGNNSPQ